MLFHLTPVSGNEKTGPIPVSTSTAFTCPLECPLSSSGCYGDGGPLAIHWRAVSNGKRGDTWDVFCSKINRLLKGTLWRHNQVGDLPSLNRVHINFAQFKQLIAANKGKRGFTYSHYNVVNIMENREAIAYANANGFTVNLSGNNLSHADQLKETDCGPVVSILPAAMGRKYDKKTKTWQETIADYHARIKGLKSPAGNPVTVCPATWQDNITCATCGLCAVANRRAIVGFPAHGVSAKKAEQK